MKTTRIVRAFRAAALSAAFLLALAPASRAANLIYYVTLDVASLTSNANGPFSLDLQLVPGSDNVTNTVTLSNFTAFGGSFTGIPSFTNGGESGSVGTSVVLTNSDPVDNEFAEPFTSSTTLIMFKVNETNNAETVGVGDPVPDQFNVAILDSGLSNIQTTDPGGGNALVSDAMVGSPFLSQVNTYTSQSPDAGVTAAAPEPGSAALLLLGAGGLLARRKRPAALAAA